MTTRENQDSEPAPVTCTLCGATSPSIEAASDAGWFPTYWVIDKATGKTVEAGKCCCPDCANTKCRDDEYQQPVLIEVEG